MKLTLEEFLEMYYAACKRAGFKGQYRPQERKSKKSVKLLVDALNEWMEKSQNRPCKTEKGG